MLEVLLVLQPRPSILVSPVRMLLWQLMKSAVDNSALTSSTLADLCLFDSAAKIPRTREFYRTGILICRCVDM